MCECEGSRPGGLPVAIKDRSRSSGARRTNPVKSVKPSQIQSKTVKILLKMVIVTRVFRSLPTRHRSLLATARSRAPDTSCSTSALRVPALTAVKTLKDQSKTVKILLNTSQIRSKILLNGHCHAWLIARCYLLTTECSRRVDRVSHPHRTNPSPARALTPRRPTAKINAKAIL